ncbi:MAG TPA: Ku protein [Thermoanaerobaculia bacterium]|nr:Ku protein [Thermoanaerobaculia bacterium]
MSARALGNASISFGLVSIPVKLYTASNSAASISFNLLHRKCGSRLKQQYICSKEETVVSRDEMVKGYEFNKDQYVQFTDEELKAFEEQATQTIEVVEFVPVEAVDPVYYDKPYYLGPDKGGAKPYRLLAEVMKETGRVALAKYAARGKQYLVMLRPSGDGLVMQQLLYADEVRPFSEVPLDKADVKEGELKLARMLVEESSSDEFRPQAYEDEVKKRVQDALDRKVAGGKFTVVEPQKKGGEIVDLMEALRASLGKPKRAAAPKAVPSAATERKPPRSALRGADKRAASSRK